MGNVAYESDFAAWALEQAALLRQGKVHQLDIEHVVEELESMGKSEHRELASRFELLIGHLLKWRHQPVLRSASWRATIAEQRRAIPRLLRDSPSLRRHLDREQWMQDVWQDGVLLAVDETGLPAESFPALPVWNAAKMLETGFFPDLEEK